MKQGIVMSLEEVMKELESYGDEVIKKIYMNHGVKEPVFGVRVQHMKKIVKKVRKNHELSLELYATGNADAMYLAGLIADEHQISKTDLKRWVKSACYYGISEYTVAWVASESKYGYELGLDWITSKEEGVASSGWSTLAYVAALKSDDELDIPKYAELLDHVAQNIHNAQNRIRFTMNGFVIAIGSYVVELHEKAMDVATKIGKIQVDMGKTACTVPLATVYIQKVVDKGKLGKKRKMARC